MLRSLDHFDVASVQHPSDVVVVQEDYNRSDLDMRVESIAGRAFVVLETKHEPLFLIFLI